jgi:hypothetical protein
VTTEKHIKLVERLYDRTKKGTMAWTESSDGSFLVSFADYSIELATERGESDEPDYRFSIRNEFGKTVESVTDVEIMHTISSPDDKRQFYAKCVELYRMARRVALGADKALASILKQLDDDDIPF